MKAWKLPEVALPRQSRVQGHPPRAGNIYIYTHSTCPQVILIYTNFCDTCDGTQERSLLLVYKAFEKQLRFLDFAIPPQILP